MPSNAPTFKTSDWQWFLQDIDTQLELQMHPDQNEIEKHLAEKRASKGEPTRQVNDSPTPAGSTRGSGNDLLAGRRRSGYGTFFATEVARAGTVNAGDEDEEMPILASSKKTSNTKSKR